MTRFPLRGVVLQVMGSLADTSQDQSYSNVSQIVAQGENDPQGRVVEHAY